MALQLRVSGVLAFAVAMLPVSFAQTSINQTIQDTGAVVTYILDTGKPSTAQLTPRDIAEKPGWTLLNADDTTHRFSGDAVLLNDRIAVVIRGSSANADVFAIAANGPKYRATISPIPSNETTKLNRETIVENTQGAVEIAAEYLAQSGATLSINYRITTGQILVQMTPGDGVDAIRVVTNPDFLLVPDFFADDIVYEAMRVPPSPVALPADNFLFQLGAGQDSIVTCAWQSTGRNVRTVVSGEGASRRVSGCDIECRAGKLVWAAFAERDGLWHKRELSGNDATRDVSLDWKPPFSAKWRTSFVGDTEVAQSWNFADARADNYNAPGLGTIVYPCWFADGAASLRAVPMKSATPLQAVVYPIDRTRETPLNEYLLVDIMRATLGVGPCQYILDTEKLDAQTSPTPALVCEYVEGQLKKSKTRRDPAAMRERIGAMAKHVELAEGRVAAYAALARDVRTIAGDTLKQNDVASQTIARILNEITASIDNLAPARRSPQDAKALADQLAALVDRDDWQEGFKKLDAELIAIGSAQDRTLAKSRMGFRRLKLYCESIAADPSPTAPVAAKIVARINGAFHEAG